MRGKALLAALIVSGILFTGCGNKQQQPGQPPSPKMTFENPFKGRETIIKVNDTKITRAEFDRIMEMQLKSGMLAQLGPEVQKDKNSFIYIMLKERVVNELIVKALLDQEIEKRGIKVTKADTDEALKEIIKQVGSNEKLDEILKQNGISPSRFKKDLAQEAAVRKLVKDLGEVTVTDADAQKFYKANQDKFKTPARVKASHILISATPEDVEGIILADPANANLSEAQIQAKVKTEVAARKVKAQKLLAQVKKDKSQFAKLAKENSEDPTTAVKGGDLGFFTANEMVPEFSKAAFSAAPNTVVANIIQTQYGYHIILVTAKQSASTEAFDKVKKNIVAYMQQQKQVALLDKTLEGLKKSAKVEYVDPEFNPAEIQKSLQKQLKENGSKERPVAGKRAPGQKPNKPRK